MPELKAKTPNKVWWSDTYNLRHKTVRVEPKLDTPYPGLSLGGSMADLNRAFLARKETLPPEMWPQRLQWRLRSVTDKDRNSLVDSQKIYMGAVMVSEAFYTVVREFDLGESQFIEVPLYESEMVSEHPSGDIELGLTVQDPRRWFLFHILPRKSALLPDQCEGLYQPSNNTWYLNGANGKLVLSSDEAFEGPDIWWDNSLEEVVFFSDRLKRAIKAAKLKTLNYSFKPCGLV